VVTHYRLKEINKKIEKDPDSELKEELIIRPTSETII
jgi:prolyl-tRNA synthetase